MFVSGDSGNNNLNGTSGNDTVTGLAGDDTINGIAGNDYLLGNQGNDIIADSDGQNTVAGGMGNDLIMVGNGANLLYGDEGTDTIQAGNGGNTIVGGTGNGAIDSLDGADFITSGAGNDLILGNGGDDTIGAGAGNDSAVGGFGNDFILGQQGNDILLGNQGDDTLVGGMGDDTLYGGMGNDLLYGNEGNDLIIGGEGVDTAAFSGTRASYTVTTDSQGDFLIAGSTGTATVSSTEFFQFSDGTVAAANLIQGTSPGGGTPTPGNGQVFLESNGQVLQTFTTIQAAVNAAAQTGNQIVVGAGTFQEQVTDNGKTLSITGQGVGKTIISSPNANMLTANISGLDANNAPTGGNGSALVGAINGANITLSGLTIDGRAQGGPGAANGVPLIGIGAVNATVTTTGTTGSTGVDITGTSAGTNSDGQVTGGGRNSGVIIENPDSMARTDNLSGLSVENYQKNGVVAYGSGLTLNLANSTITGSGDVNTIAQNGIEFLNGATGSVKNNMFSSIGYTGSDTTATDILVDGADSSFIAAQNVINGGVAARAAQGNLGVSLAETNGGTITGNTFNDLYQAIDDEPNQGQARGTLDPNTYNRVTVQHN